MRKLKLELADIEVTSFEVPSPAKARGTVAAHALPPPTERDPSCIDYLTCNPMMGTCWNTCGEPPCFTFFVDWVVCF